MNLEIVLISTVYYLFGHFFEKINLHCSYKSKQARFCQSPVTKMFRKTKCDEIEQTFTKFVDLFTTKNYCVTIAAPAENVKSQLGVIKCSILDANQATCLQ